MHIEIAQIFTQIVSFLIVLWVLKRFAWKPVLKVIEDRENKIRSEFDGIEKQKAENNRLSELYKKQLDDAAKEVKDLIKEGKENGKKIAKEIEDNAHRESKKIIAHTKSELQKEIHKAKGELKQELVTITLAATEKIVKSEMDPKRQEALVHQFLQKESR